MKRRTLTASPFGALVFGGLALSYHPFILHNTLPGYLLLTSLILAHFSVLYFIASKTQGTPITEWMRGAMIGTNAALNYALLDLIFGSTFFAGLLASLVFLSAWLVVSRSRWFHPLLGWVAWFLPMTWLVSIPGLLIFIVNLAFAPFGSIHPAFAGLRVRLYLDLRSSTFTMYGGLIRPIKGFSGLNMGQFIFINPGWEHLLRHEIGHLFSLAALGFAFHYIGGIDEGFMQKHYWKAYAEYMAESYNEPGEGGKSMWG